MRTVEDMREEAAVILRDCSELEVCGYLSKLNWFRVKNALALLIAERETWKARLAAAEDAAWERDEFNAL